MRREEALGLGLGFLLASLVDIRFWAPLAVVEAVVGLAAALLMWRGRRWLAIALGAAVPVAAAAGGMGWALAPLVASLPGVAVAKGERRISAAYAGLMLSVFMLVTAGLVPETNLWETGLYVAAFSLFSSLAVAAGLVPAIEGQGT